MSHYPGWGTTTPLPAFNAHAAVPQTPSPSTRGRGTGAKRGRKPRGATTGVGTPGPTTHASLASRPASSTPPTPATPAAPVLPAPATSTALALPGQAPAFTPPSLPGSRPTDATASTSAAAGTSANSAFAVGAPGLGIKPQGAAEEDGDGDDEQLPAMADDDYSAQLKWQSQSKADLKVLMDHFSPLQRERYESYRRSYFNKQAVRRLIHQSLGLTVSPNVAQVVAGFSKVFAGEIIEKARVVQEQRREVGPLSPDHLREAYRLYQEETGRVGAARPLRGKRLFMR